MELSSAVLYIKLQACKSKHENDRRDFKTINIDQLKSSYSKSGFF